MQNDRIEKRMQWNYEMWWWPVLVWFCRVTKTEWSVLPTPSNSIGSNNIFTLHGWNWIGVLCWFNQFPEIDPGCCNDTCNNCIEVLFHFFFWLIAKKIDEPSKITDKILIPIVHGPKSSFSIQLTWNWLQGRMVSFQHKTKQSSTLLLSIYLYHRTFFPKASKTFNCKKGMWNEANIQARNWTK